MYSYIYNKNNFIMNNIFIEEFNVEVLNYIIHYKDYFKTLIGGNDEENENVFIQLEKYQKNSSNGLVQVKYNKKYNRGRLFADGGLSLQNISRKIRGSISSEFYYDVDMVNAHPQIIYDYLNNKGITLIFLHSYISNRDNIINNILKINDGLEFSEIKMAILSKLYGGNKDFKKIKNKTKWMEGFELECNEILNLTAELFPEEYELQKQIKGINYNNLNGCTLSSYICCIEDNLLHILIHKLKEHKIFSNKGVLCFDGLMVPKINKINKKEKKIDLEKLNLILSEVEETFKNEGYNIKLKIKDFEKLNLDIPYEIKEKIDNKIKKEKEKKENSNINEYLKYDNYFWYDFRNDMTKYIFSSLDKLIDVFLKNINKVMFRIISQNDAIYIKVSQKDMFKYLKNIPKENFNFYEINKYGIIINKSISLQNLLIKTGLISKIKIYNNLDFLPYTPFNKLPDHMINNRNINTWTGFDANLIPEIEVDKSKIDMILNHIKIVWANNNIEHYNYILKWFKNIFINPRRKNKVALVLKSYEKQIGKGILINSFLIPYVFGKQYGVSVCGLDNICAKFNQSLMNKIFINCDELCTISGNFHQAFEILKNRITEPTLSIEIKGGDKFDYPDYSNFLMTTNHDFTIKIEPGDKRYFVIECNPYYKNNFNYFNNLSECFTPEVANHFYSYISYYDNNVEIRNIPMTPIKREMIIAGLQPSLRFLIYLNDKIKYFEKEGELSITNTNEGINNMFSLEGMNTTDLPNKDIDNFNIPAKKLYSMFNSWCDNYKEKSCSITKFGRDINKNITKKRFTNCIKYDLNSIKLNF